MLAESGSLFAAVDVTHNSQPTRMAGLTQNSVHRYIQPF
jgi:hypothetical protein